MKDYNIKIKIEEESGIQVPISICRMYTSNGRIEKCIGTEYEVVSYEYKNKYLFSKTKQQARKLTQFQFYIDGEETGMGST